MDYLWLKCKSEISNVCNAVEGHYLQAMKTVHHHANGRFHWLISEHQSVNPSREAISILSGKYKKFKFVHLVNRYSKMRMRAIEPKCNRRIFASHSSVHSGFSKGSLSLYVMIIIIKTYICDFSITTHIEVMEQWKSCAIVIRAAGSSPTGQLSIPFPHQSPKGPAVK